MNEIVTIISTIGFPCAVCLVVMWYVKYSTDKYQTQIDDINKRHAEEMARVTDALNNNTLALTRLCDKIEALKGGEQ